MYTTAAAVLGLTLAQPPAAAPDYYTYTTRAIDIPIDYRKDPKDVRRLELWMSANGDGVWKPVLNAPPTQAEFKYTAPDDGFYWFHLRIVDLAGNADPRDVATEPGPMKVLIDTRPPRVAVTAARREGRQAVVEWKVDDKHPNDAATAVHFATAAGEWVRVDLPPGRPTGVRFPADPTNPKTIPLPDGPVTVKVTVADLAGNPGEVVHTIGGAAPPPPPSAVTPAGGLAPPGGELPPPASIVPQPGPLAPAAPPAPAYQPPPVAAAPPTNLGAYTPSSPGSAAQPLPAAGGALPTIDPKATPATPPPAPTSGGFAPPAPPAAADNPAVRVIRSPQFDINYSVELQGGSKIGRIDLYVTRDDGRSWRRWSQHPGGTGVVHVNLNITENTQPEGTYGFRLVSVSGTGVSDDAPNPGDAPDLRLVVDLTRPAVAIRAPSPDPTDPAVLVLNWAATDNNFGDDPILLEWSEGQNGPWRPVATSADGPVQQAGAVGVGRRVANTGQYAWRVPPGLPPRVFLKITVRDAAGNATELVTKDPQPIDLTKPKVRITGLGGGR